jgi:hypothetical protein
VTPDAHRIWLKRALLLIVIGLLVQMFCLLHITPASFLTFAFFGVGSVFMGLVMFGVAVMRKRAADAAGAGEP